MARKKTVPVQIKIRLPEALRRDLEREAAKNGRTLNGEIVHRLTQPFVQADRLAVATAAADNALAKFAQQAMETYAKATFPAIKPPSNPKGDNDQ
jgi:Arc-like DNA binding domain